VLWAVACLATIARRKNPFTNLYGYVYGNPINLVDMDGLLPSLPQWLVDGAAGFGDTLSFGLTDKVRDWMGTNGVVDKCSTSYFVGEVAGTAHGLVGGGVGVVKIAGVRSAAKGAGSLKSLMKNSPFKPTQSAAKMDLKKVDQFSDMMKNGKWDWSKSKIIVDKNGALMSGHHRVVAAQKAGVKIPESAIYRFDGVTERITHQWSDVLK